MMDKAPAEDEGREEADTLLVLRGLSDLADAHRLEIRLGQTVVVGRSRSCDWSLRRTPPYLSRDYEARTALNGNLAFSSVSRKHLQISRVSADMVELQNLSGNGTLLDGRLIDRVVLTDCRMKSHRIQLGPKGVILEMQPVGVTP